MIPTPQQTIGPFFGFALPRTVGPFVVAEGEPGSFWIRGRVLDGDGQPVTDALIETWQADAAGEYRPGLGFGRCGTDATGAWAVHTTRPGRVPGERGPQAPHVAVSVHARGLLRRLVTRIYFADEPAANAEDLVLANVDPARRATLLARPTEDGFALDIRLQGRDETVFFEG